MSQSLIEQIEKAIEKAKVNFLKSEQVITDSQKAYMAAGFDDGAQFILPLLKLVLEQRNKYAESGRWAPCMTEKDDLDLIKLLGVENE